MCINPFICFLRGRGKVKRLIGAGSVAQGICWRMRNEVELYFADEAGLGLVKTGKKTQKYSNHNSRTLKGSERHG